MLLTGVYNCLFINSVIRCSIDVHLLLCRPWLFDDDAIHVAWMNTYFIKINGTQCTLFFMQIGESAG